MGSGRSGDSREGGRLCLARRYSPLKHDITEVCLSCFCSAWRHCKSRRDSCDVLVLFGRKAADSSICSREIGNWKHSIHEHNLKPVYKRRETNVFKDTLRFASLVKHVNSATSMRMSRLKGKKTNLEFSKGEESSLIYSWRPKNSFAVECKQSSPTHRSSLCMWKWRSQTNHSSKTVRDQEERL